MREYSGVNIFHSIFDINFDELLSERRENNGESGEKDVLWLLFYCLRKGARNQQQKKWQTKKSFPFVDIRCL